MDSGTAYNGPSAFDVLRSRVVVVQAPKKNVRAYGMHCTVSPYAYAYQFSGPSILRGARFRLCRPFRHVGFPFVDSGVTSVTLKVTTSRKPNNWAKQK
jgi:hypothetical protein